MRPPAPCTRCAAAALLAATLLAVGCDDGQRTAGGDEGHKRATSTPQETAESTGAGTLSATPQSVPTTAPPEAAEDGETLEVPEAGEPPSLEGLYSEDELEVARTMNKYYAWLMSHPDTEPKLVDEIFDEPLETNSEQAQREIAHELVSQYQEHKWWWTGSENIRVVDVDVLDEQAPHVRVVRIYYHRESNAKLVDQQGNVHSTRSPERSWTKEVWTREGHNSPWQTISVLSTGTWKEGDR